MQLRHTKPAAVLSLLLLSLATVANAAVLWDQSALDFDPNASAIFNAKATGFGGGTVYSVNDVTVPAAGWTINTIVEYYSDWNSSWNTTATTGYLIIQPKTGAMPSGAPSLATIVPLSWVDTSIGGQGVYVMTAAGLNVVLTPGDYWITVSPIGTAGISGANLQWPSTTHIGADVASWDGTGWYTYYPGEEGAMLILGTVGSPTPTVQSSFGQLKALYR